MYIPPSLLEYEDDGYDSMYHDSYFRYISGTEYPPTILDLILGYRYRAIGNMDEGAVRGSNKFSLKARCAAKLRISLVKLGPVFVKLGQIMSSRPDLLSSEVITELQALVSCVEPFPTSEAIEVII